jgi:hypothetical protein
MVLHCALMLEPFDYRAALEPYDYRAGLADPPLRGLIRPTA